MVLPPLGVRVENGHLVRLPRERAVPGGCDGSRSCIGFAVVNPGVASADENCSSSHCYSVSKTATDFSYGSSMEGPDTYTAVNPTYAGYWGHFNSEGWSLLDNGDYLEAGIRNGYPVNGQPYATYYFWADHQVVGGVDSEYFHPFGTVTFNPDQFNIYSFERCGAIYNWCFYFDGSYWGMSGITANQGGNWAITNLEVGGELASTTCNNIAAYAPDRLMSGALINTSWVQYTPWLNTLQIDSPCGFEGTNHGVIGEWSWQKHSPP